MVCVCVCWWCSNVVQVTNTGMVPERGALENYVVGRRVHPYIETKDDLFSGLNIGILELANPFIFDGKEPLPDQVE